MNGWRIPLIIFVGLMFTGIIISTNLYAEEYSLDDLYRIGLEQSEKIKISEEDLYIAERGKDKAFAVLLPQLSAFGNYTKYNEKKFNAKGTLIQPDKDTSWGLMAEESFSLSGRELTALGISRENIIKSRYDLYAIREGHLLNIALAYYDVLRVKKTLDISESNLERLTKYRDAAQKRLKVGEVTKTVLLRAEGELSGARSDYVKVKNLLELAKTVLARVVGIKGDFQLKEEHSEDIVIPSESSYLEAALSGRADLKSLEIQKKIAEEKVWYTKGAFWPTLSLTGVYAKSDESPETLSLVRESSYGLVTLNFPFFEGGLRNAEVKEARAKERQSALLYEDYKKSIGVEVQSAYLDLVTQKGILKFLEDQLVYARDNYNAVTKQFEFGLSQSLDVMDANTLLVTAERDLAAAIYNYQIAILKMKKATGTLLKTVIGEGP